jgi:predicted dehydrogenase
MTSALYNVMILGCGNMAGGYDLLQTNEELPLGHAKAFINHGSFNLKACVEPDNAKRTAFQQKWLVPQGFGSLNDPLIQVGMFDVISICSPTHSHSEDIQKALALKPKLIFCEKPITASLEDSRLAVAACATQQVLLAVNYSRRWSPQVIQLKSELALNNWGAIRSVTAVYNKGILNNGSHILDLLICLFGPLNIASVGQMVNDFFTDDPTIDATLVTEMGVPIQLNVSHANDYSFFEMQIVTEKGVINMEDGGARWRFRHAQTSEKLLGYRFLNSGEWKEPNGSYALTCAVANIFDSLSSGFPLASSGKNALEVQSLCAQIKNLASIQAEDHNFKKETV